jgi:hypothetical protein
MCVSNIIILWAMCVTCYVPDNVCTSIMCVVLTDDNCAASRLESDLDHDGKVTEDTDLLEQPGTSSKSICYD